MRKILFMILGISGGLFLLLYGGLSLLDRVWINAAFKKEPDISNRIVFLKDSDSAVELGKPFEVAVSTHGSVHYERMSVDWALPEGLAAVGKPRESRGGYAWGPHIFNSTQTFRAYKAGTYDNIQATVIFRGETVPDTQLVCDSGMTFAVTVLPGESTPEPEAELAGIYTPPEADLTLYYLAGGGIVLIQLLIIAGLAVYFMRRKYAPKQRVVPPWESALMMLQTLRSEILQDKLSLERATALLTDLVRLYLSERFKVCASSMTTPEFFSLLSRHNSPLTLPQRDFLRRFMESADLIKFAGVNADASMLESALAQAQSLVEETRPQSPNGGQS